MTLRDIRDIKLSRTKDNSTWTQVYFTIVGKHRTSHTETSVGLRHPYPDPDNPIRYRYIIVWVLWHRDHDKKVFSSQVSIVWFSFISLVSRRVIYRIFASNRTRLELKPSIFPIKIQKIYGKSQKFKNEQFWTFLGGMIPEPVTCQSSLLLIYVL